ncbi:ATP diphosphatase [Candidatus Electronema halotolerans]
MPVQAFQRLEEIVRILRSERGCPWDQKQTAASLKKYLLEEAAELAEAIDQGDPALICEEAGDLHFVLALLLAICEEQGGCSAAAALNAACEKMRRRHPHVFAADQETTLSEAQLREQWERIKQEEKKAKAQSLSVTELNRPPVSFKIPEGKEGND